MSCNKVLRCLTGTITFEVSIGLRLPMQRENSLCLCSWDELSTAVIFLDGGRRCCCEMAIRRKHKLVGKFNHRKCLLTQLHWKSRRRRRLFVGHSEWKPFGLEYILTLYFLGENCATKFGFKNGWTCLHERLVVLLALIFSSISLWAIH